MEKIYLVPSDGDDGQKEPQEQTEKPDHIAEINQEDIIQIISDSGSDADVNHPTTIN